MTKNGKGTTPQTPARATPRARSAKKGARATRRRAGQPWPDATRAEAVTLMREEGMAAAHDVTGVPKATLSTWARAESLDLGEAARRRTATATEAVKERAERARVGTVQLLEDHIGEAGSYLSAIVKANAQAAELIAGLDPDVITIRATEAGTEVVLGDDVAASASRVAQALATLPLAVRDAEGIITRAIHDLQLLRGEATERGELVVEFGGIPRPNPRKVQVTQLTEADED